MKVHHVGYLVKKLERAERDFMRLGYERETDTVYDPIRQVDISFWKNGDYRIELVSPKTEESVVYELMKTCKTVRICPIIFATRRRIWKKRGAGSEIRDSSPWMSLRRLWPLTEGESVL